MPSLALRRQTDYHSHVCQCGAVASH
jgi:hypothetical protein